MIKFHLVKYNFSFNKLIFFIKNPNVVISFSIVVYFKPRLLFYFDNIQKRLINTNYLILDIKCLFVKLKMGSELVLLNFVSCQSD